MPSNIPNSSAPVRSNAKPQRTQPRMTLRLRSDVATALQQLMLCSNRKRRERAQVINNLLSSALISKESPIVVVKFARLAPDDLRVLASMLLEINVRLEHIVLSLNQPLPVAGSKSVGVTEWRGHRVNLECLGDDLKKFIVALSEQVQSVNAASPSVLHRVVQLEGLIRKIISLYPNGPATARLSDGVEALATLCQGYSFAANLDGQGTAASLASQMLPPNGEGAQVSVSPVNTERSAAEPTTTGILP